MAKQTRRYRDEDRSLDLYLREIGSTPLISAAQEVKLARRIKQGDQSALDQLTKANLRFVVSVAKNYQNQGLSLADLINEANLGLIKAAKRFDETRGFKFISFPEERLSTTETSQPSLIRRSTRCEPINPAPPVTNALILIQTSDNRRQTTISKKLCNHRYMQIYTDKRT